MPIGLSFSTNCAILVFTLSLRGRRGDCFIVDAKHRDECVGFEIRPARSLRLTYPDWLAAQHAGIGHKLPPLAGNNHCCL
jgi:hypothetical protein